MLRHRDFLFGTIDNRNEMDRRALIEELVEFFIAEHIIVHGAKGVEGFDDPPEITNSGYGDSRPRIPDVIGLDKEKRRIVFGIVRSARGELDSEEALAEYNVFLDHRYAKGDEASVLYVLLPGEFLQDFTGLITHYIHREYWHRIKPVVSKHPFNPNG